MELQNQLRCDKKQLQLCFIELLYKERLINKATYYGAKKFLYTKEEKK